MKLHTDGPEGQNRSCSRRQGILECRVEIEGRQYCGALQVVRHTYPSDIIRELGSRADAGAFISGRVSIGWDSSWALRSTFAGQIVGKAATRAPADALHGAVIAICPNGTDELTSSSAAIPVGFCKGS
jgi:hypothetical protein